jgi:MFS family permease
VLRPYLAVLRTPGVALPLVAGILGALPIGMLTVGILLFVRTETGSLAAAGAVAGAYGAGNAIGLALQGRLIDRYGQPIVLIPAGLSCATSLVLLVFATSADPVAEAVFAGAAGIALPATTTSMRALLPELVADDRHRTTGYALLAVSFQLTMVLGPLVVSALLAITGPGSAILCAAALAAIAGTVFASTAASRAWRPTPRPAGRIPSSGLRTLLVGTTGTGFGAGLISVGIPAIALEHGSASLAALLFATASIGDLAGGFGYGAYPSRRPKSSQLILALCGGSVAAFVIAMVSGWLVLLFAAVLLAGAVGAPAGISTSALLDTVVPSGAITRSYALLVCLGLLSGSGGSAAGGALADAAGGRTLFLIDGCCLAGAAVWTLTRRRTLGKC